MEAFELSGTCPTISVTLAEIYAFWFDAGGHGPCPVAIFIRKSDLKPEDGTMPELYKIRLMRLCWSVILVSVPTANHTCDGFHGIASA